MAVCALKWLIWPLIGLIKAYQAVVSPLFPRSCRFYPTCSAYSVSALRKHGFIKGVGLTIRRVSRCHPGHPGGYDPVP